MGLFRTSQQVDERASGEQIQLQKSQDLLQAAAEIGLEAQEREQQIQAKCHQDLSHDRVLTGSQECLDLQILLDPLEEQLDLPALLINLGNCLCRPAEVIGNELVVAAGLRVPVADTSDR